MQDLVAPVQSRASRRRGEPPPYRYHVLDPRSIRRRSEPAGEPAGDAHVPIHWVRGHFKRYTPEKPRLGRHVGVFWFQPHPVGKGQGVVDNDYRVEVTRTEAL